MRAAVPLLVLPTLGGRHVLSRPAILRWNHGPNESVGGHVRWLQVCRVAALMSVAALLSGCWLEGKNCTDIGGSNGIVVQIADELWVTQGDVSITVCDHDGCASVVRHVGKMPRDVPTPVGRGSDASFDDLGRMFEPGTVQVTVELRDQKGRLVARRGADVGLTRYWPNGKACDGDGYVSGGIDLRAEDAVAGSS